MSFVPLPSRSNATLTFNFGGAQVLLIDSNAASMSVLCQILSGFGMRRFIRCTDMSQLEAIVRTQTVDLILADPSGFGQPLFDWLLRFRQERLARNASTLVLIATTHACLEEVTAARECGADYVVTKPLSPSVLLERILWAARRDGRSGRMNTPGPLASIEANGLQP